MANVTIQYSASRTRTLLREDALRPSAHTTFSAPLDTDDLDLLLGRLLDKLIDKGVFTLEDARDVLNGWNMTPATEDAS
jgi:hypothetical protein